MQDTQAIRLAGSGPGRDGLADDLVARKVQIIVSQARMGMVFSLVLCAVFGFIFIRSVGWPAFLAWYAVVATALVGRKLYFASLLRRRGATPATLSAIAWVSAASGLLAVGGLALFARSLSVIDLAVMSAIMVGWTAVTVSVLAVRPRIYLVFVVLSLASVLLAWRGHGDLFAMITLGAALVFGAGLLFNLALLIEKQQNTEYEHQTACTDMLTRLPNREGIRLDGEALLRQGLEPLVLVLALNRFKAMNDALGFEFGDAVLIEVGRRLGGIECVRASRLHASQFCLLAPNASDQHAVFSAIRERFAHPLHVLGESVDVGFTIGMAVAPGHGRSMPRLIRAAAIAARAAQRMNADLLAFSEGLEIAKPSYLILMSELREAVEQSQLQMYLQPKVRLADGMVPSAEALVRWRHPLRGMVPPSEFVPFAEQTGSIRLLTEWMLRQAMLVTVEQQALGTPLQISVNISVSDLRDHRLALRAQELASQLGADPSHIRLEVTESSVMDQPDQALSELRALREVGFTLSIDDFGTGYSSLSYLQKMPVHELKIDRAFVAGVRAGAESEGLLDSIGALAHRMGLSVVAEGVETATEWAIVKKLGIEYVQGWYASKAMPVAEFCTWRAAHQPFLPV